MVPLHKDIDVAARARARAMEYHRCAKSDLQSALVAYLQHGLNNFGRDTEPTRLRDDPRNVYSVPLINSQSGSL